MDLLAIIAVSWWAIIPLAVVGTVLHFLFDWSRHHPVVAVFAAVNESYWEHIKIAVWPVALQCAVLFALGGFRYPSFVPAATLALYSIPITMVGLVILYKALAGRNVLWLDIAIFVAVIAVAELIFVSVLRQLHPDVITVAVSVAYLAGLLVAFVRFTHRPPREPDVFVDPLTSRYGIRGHGDIDG
jgi:hypothetical protein